jgi:hypothetical protein
MLQDAVVRLRIGATCFGVEYSCFHTYEATGPLAALT